MQIKEIYDKANAAVGVSQGDFLSALGEALLDISSRYGETAVFEGDVFYEVTSIDDDAPIRHPWKIALLHYVLWRKTGDGVRKTDYDAAISYAYRTVWRELSGKKKRFHVPSWR